MDKPIGGYFGWEFPFSNGHFPHDNGTLVNSGHHGLQIILQHLDHIKKIYIPYYTCDSILIPLHDLGIAYEFYHINEQLEIDGSIALLKGELLIYTNYFGIKDTYAASLARKYGKQLIIDNAQALYANPSELCYQFYSPRKFVAAPDGGIVWPKMQIAKNLRQSKSYDKCLSLLMRADGNISKGHTYFKVISKMLAKAPPEKMSQLTECIMRSKDYNEIKFKRIYNFNYIHSQLKNINILTQAIESVFECPLVYPFYADDTSLRKKLIANNIYVAQYWPNVLEWCKPGDIEYELTSHIIAIPIDQRYGIEDMRLILAAIKE